MKFTYLMAVLILGLVVIVLMNRSGFQDANVPPTQATNSEPEIPGDIVSEKPDSVETTSQPPEQDSVAGLFNELSADAAYVILRKGTEPASNDGYTLTKDPGTYICRQCNAKLYHATDKFESHCGWPSFDDEITGAVERHVDADGYRVEIVCDNCKGHLGHVFEGERLTEKNVRHCVNSISMIFIPEGKEIPAKIVNSEPEAEQEPAAE